MKTPSRVQPSEADSVYFLKLLLFFILGAIWLYLPFTSVPLPIGFVLGVLFARHDHFQVDRKIEYAILLVAAILSLVAPIGIVLDATAL
ncbi:MAG: hypothetical protein WD467_03895 [Candidatus Saccharimonadales bacterium]